MLAAATAERSEMVKAIALAVLALLVANAAQVDAFKVDAKCAKISVRDTPGGKEYSLYSHEDYELGSEYSNHASCNWSILAPQSSGYTWRVKFHEVDLESSTTSSQCMYDNLTVIYERGGLAFSTVLCGKHYGLVLLTNGSFRLSFRSDASISHRGFRVTWLAIPPGEARPSEISPVFLGQGAIGSCGYLMTHGAPIIFGGRAYNVTKLGMSVSDGSYLHNADCTWYALPAGNSTAVYLTIEFLMLEGSPSCSLDNITVTYRLPGRLRSQRRVLCHSNTRLRLVSRDLVTLQLRTDHSVGQAFSVSWFVAPYTGLSGRFESSPEFVEESCPEVALRGRSGGRIQLYYEPPMTYASHMRCSWIVSVPAGRSASFKFTRFQLARRTPWTGAAGFCTHREDAIRIGYTDGASLTHVTKTFCMNDPAPIQKPVIPDAVGLVTVSFISNGYQNSHGFVLEFTYGDEPATSRAGCPPVRRLNRWRQQIANFSLAESTFLSETQTCSWYLQPPSDNHVMSLMITMYSRTPYISYNSRYNDLFPYSPRRYSSRFYLDSACDPKVLVTSNSFISDGTMPTVQDPGTLSGPYAREFCPTIRDLSLGLFAGGVNISIRSQQRSLDLRGFGALMTSIPKIQKGCSTVKVATEYYKFRVVKVFQIDGKAGCVASESLRGFSSAFSSTYLKVVLQLNCKRANSNESLNVVSESLVTTLDCGRTRTIYGQWKESLVLIFPTETDATVIANVTYNFAVSEGFCQKLNSRAVGRNTSDSRAGASGSFLLPLVVPYAPGYTPLISCTYHLPYRHGFSIQLRISHNLGHSELDSYCHTKFADKQVRSHILVTVSEMDPDRGFFWMGMGTQVDTQLDMCHGYEVGSLTAKPELLIDGSLSISLLAVSSEWGANRSERYVSPPGLFQMLNRTQPQALQFLIAYRYVPSCPEFECRSIGTSGQRNGCNGPMSDVQLTASLGGVGVARKCRLDIPTYDTMRSYLAWHPSRWLAKLEFTDFVLSCPCHSCDVDELQQEYIAVSHYTQDTTLEQAVVCGNFANKSKVIYMAFESTTGVQINYRLLDSRVVVGLTFVNCKTNPNLQECGMALLQNRFESQSLGLAAPASHGGLIFATVLLAAILIGCLLFLNRQSVLACGGQVQERLRPRIPPRSEDLLQLTPEPLDAP